MTTDGWQGILEAGETILWQGQPEGRLSMDWTRASEAAFGLFMALFALVWIWGAAQAGGLFWAFGLVFLGLGLWQALQPNLIASLNRRRTWYTLTDRRAFIATDWIGAGRRLASYPITADTLIDLEQASATTGLGAVWFTTGRAQDWSNWSRPQAPRAGFDRIRQPEQVAAQMRDLQARARKGVTA